MSKHNNFKKQIDKYLNQVPIAAINSNEILLRLIVQELAVIVDSIAKIAQIDYDVKVEGEDDTGDTGKSKRESQDP